MGAPSLLVLPYQQVHFTFYKTSVCTAYLFPRPGETNAGRSGKLCFKTPVLLCRPGRDDRCDQRGYTKCKGPGQLDSATESKICRCDRNTRRCRQSRDTNLLFLERW